jgi:hypothetical protein
MRAVSVSVSAYVDPDEVLDQLDDEDLKELFQKHLPLTGVAVPEGQGRGDVPIDRIVEQAFLATKRLPAVPEALRDLFWRVHGLALA